LNRVRLVETVSGTEEGDDVERPLILPDDRDLLKRTVRQTGAQLVVIDPLMAHLAEEVNPHQDQSVRRALTPLSTLAEEEEVAVLVIRHLNKSGDQTPKYRGQGSIGFIGQARVAWLMAEHPKDEDRRVLASTKNNLASPPSSRAFHLEKSKTQEAVRILWDGTVDLNARDLLGKTGSDRRGRKPEKREKAEGWLQAGLADGPVEKNELIQKAEAANISKRTLERAKDELDIESAPDEYQGEYKWRLPQDGN